MHNSQYWDKRALDKYDFVEKQSEEYMDKIKSIYTHAFREIDKDIHRVYTNYLKDLKNNSELPEIDTQKLKELLTKSETEKTWKELKQKGLDKYIQDNYKARISRLEQIQAQVYSKIKMISYKENETATEMYKGVINDSYYKTMVDIQQGFNQDFEFSRLDNNLINTVLDNKWSGKNYSQRIWKNTDILAEKVSDIIGGGLIRGQSIEKMSRQLREQFNAGKYYADRLARTEMCHFYNEADRMAYEELGVDKYVFMAVLDNRTSEYCQEMDNKIIEYKDIKVGENFPPLHPNCRSTTRGYIEGFEDSIKRRAKNPITGENEVIDNISYKEWINKFKDNDSLSKADYDTLINKTHNVVDGKNIVGKFKINEKEKYNDGGINRIMEIQGYKGVPKIVNNTDFEKYCKESNFFAQRIYGGKSKKEVYDYQRQLYSSNWYINCSVGGSQYGKGMYCAAVYDLKDNKGIKGITEEMKHYISLSKIRKNPYFIVEDITIDKSAKIIKYKDIIPTYIKEMAKIDNWSENELLIYDNYYNKISKYNIAYQNYIANWRQGTNIQSYLDEYYKYKKEAENVRKQFTNKMNSTYTNSLKNKDISTLAVEMGYDVINAEGHGQSGSYTVILNRTKLIIRSGGKYYGG